MSERELPNRIREQRRNKGLTAEKLAELAGLSVSYLTRLEVGDRNLSGKSMKAIARALGIEEADLLHRASDQRQTLVPVVSWVSAGRMAAREAVTPRDVTRWISVGDLPPGDWIALEVDGDSMNRVASEGAIIVVDRNDRQLASGKDYVFAYDDGESTFKRYRSDPDRLEPASTNPVHDTIFPKHGLTVVGRVRRAIADFD